MVEVIFYEKPGCITNTWQKKILGDAGYKIDARNLLTEPWTAEILLEFFANLPVEDWFNQSAPAVKSGVIDPAAVSKEDAIEYMLEDPLLIRRPLIEVDRQKIVGFELERIKELFTIAETQDGDLEKCPKDHWSPCDPR